MEQFKELFKSLQFIKAACYVVSALVLAFAPKFAIETGVLVTLVLAVVNSFGIKPELLAKRNAAINQASRVSKLRKAK